MCAQINVTDLLFNKTRNYTTIARLANNKKLYL